MIDLSGKVALITGGARGIGAATAEIFVAAGASVVIGDILEKEGADLAARLGKATARYAHHDVTDEAGGDAVIARAIDAFGGLDILVNNAGIEQTRFFTDLELTDIQRLLNVNVAGVLLGHKHAIRAMKPGGAAGRGGSIVNLSSVAGLMGFPGLGVYSACKGAVRLISKAAAVECGRLGFGIRVNSVHPGYVETEMGTQLLQSFVDIGAFPNYDAAAAAMLASHPIGRTGVPKDVAQAISFLASDLSSWITGTEMVLDGGMTVS